MNLIEGRAATANREIRFGDPDYSAWFADALILAEHIWPIPFTYPAQSSSLIDQVKSIRRKFEHTQGIHRGKLDAVAYALLFGLSARVVKHVRSDIHSH